MKMKILPVLVCAVLISAPCHAQGRKTKAALASKDAQIARLQMQRDSLMALVDSLSALEYELQQDSPEPAFRPGPLPLATTDSLVGEWYAARRYPDYEAARNMDIESAHFTTQVPDSVLMRRLVEMNSYITLPFNETVRNYMVLYSEKMPANMRALLGKSVYYFPLFEEILDRYGLPLELKYMSIIESNLNPTARSRMGAMGLWQFMYGTARGYGLKINSFVDERRDVVKSTEAAARYLRDAYDIFGDWNLAISSYNCGAANVQKAIRRAGSTRFWDIYDFLPRETRGYVPAFVGCMYAFTYREAYGLKPADVGMPAACDTFEIRRNLHFKQISETVGIPEQTLRDLNPQYTHDIIPGSEGGCILRIPYSYSAAFMEVPSDTLYSHRADSLLNPQVLKNIRESGSERRIAYKVKSGDVLGRIALRNGVTVSQIKKWNHLRSDTIRPGQILYIYKR